MTTRSYISLVQFQCNGKAQSIERKLESVSETFNNSFRASALSRGRIGKIVCGVIIR